MSSPSSLLASLNPARRFAKGFAEYLDSLFATNGLLDSITLKDGSDEELLRVKAFIEQRFPSGEELSTEAYEAVDELPRSNRDRYVVTKLLVKRLFDALEYRYQDEELLTVDSLLLVLGGDSDSGGESALADLFGLNLCVLNAICGLNRPNTDSPGQKQRGQLIPNHGMDGIGLVSMINDVAAKRGEDDESDRALAMVITNLTTRLCLLSREDHEATLASIPIADTPGANLNQNTQLKFLGLLLQELYRYRAMMGAAPDGSSTKTVNSPEEALKVHGFSVYELYLILAEESGTGGPIWPHLRTLVEAAGAAPLEFKVHKRAPNLLLHAREAERHLLGLLEPTEEIQEDESGEPFLVPRELSEEAEAEIEEKIEISSNIEQRDLFHLKSLIELRELFRLKSLTLRVSVDTVNEAVDNLQMDNKFLESGGTDDPLAEFAKKRFRDSGYTAEALVCSHKEGYRGVAWLLTDPKRPELLGVAALRGAVLNSLFRPSRNGIDNGRRGVISGLVSQIAVIAKERGAKQVIVPWPATIVSHSLLAQGYTRLSGAGLKWNSIGEFLEPFAISAEECFVLDI